MTNKHLIEHHNRGDQRTYVAILRPGLLPVKDGSAFEIKRTILVKMTEEFDGHGWHDIKIDLDSAIVAPSRWRRLWSWLFRRVVRRDPIPRVRVVKTHPTKGRRTAGL